MAVGESDGLLSSVGGKPKNEMPLPASKPLLSFSTHTRGTYAHHTPYSEDLPSKTTCWRAWKLHSFHTGPSTHTHALTRTHAQIRHVHVTYTYTCCVLCCTCARVLRCTCVRSHCQRTPRRLLAARPTPPHVYVSLGYCACVLVCVLCVSRKQTHNAPHPPRTLETPLHALTALWLLVNGVWLVRYGP